MMHVIDRHLDHGSSRNRPKRIVIHAMGHYILHDGTFKSAASFLDDVGLSAHALIAFGGEVIRCRHDTEGAWHAKGHNTDTLGVEFLVPGQHDYTSFVRAMDTPGWVSAFAFAAGVELVRGWCEQHDIRQIVRHSDIDPTRKRDPGKGFPWDRFLAAVDRV
jgi:N-acetyl-anhydromuramyl-L-alanine amidase AmpD